MIAEIKPSHVHELLEPIWGGQARDCQSRRPNFETTIGKKANIDDLDFRIPPNLLSSSAKLPKRPKRHSTPPRPALRRGRAPLGELGS